MTVENIPEVLSSAIEYLLIIVGAASLIVAGLEKIADLTPTDKDNIAIGKAKRFLARVIAILDRLAVNPDKTKARDPDGDK
jgi:hypothetical protein